MAGTPDSGDGAPPSDGPIPEVPPTSGPKSLTIGAVVKGLVAEFPDISISKIRYLEDQKLLTPRRTPGGYRLYSAGDVSRLRTILRLQRDEFLPLRVIRQELSAGRGDPEVSQPVAPAAAVQEVTPIAAPQLVGAGTAGQRVVAATAGYAIRASSAREDVISAGSDDAVRTCASFN